MKTTTELKNGKYVGEMLAYKGAKRRINVFQGKCSIYTMQGQYICDLTTDVVIKEYRNLVKPPKPLYNLVWMVGGVIKEHLMQNVSYALARHKKNEFEGQAQYRGGLILPVPSDLS